MLYGLECENKACVHDSVISYRLRLQLLPDRECTVCHRGREVPIDQAALRLGLDPVTLDDGQTEQCKNWYECPALPPHVEPWRRQLQQERNDMVFKAHQLQSAYAQMSLLGCDDPKVGVSTVERHPSIPPGFDTRILILKEEPLGRIAVYMRWKPETGEKLTNEMCFQGMFGPGMSADERKNALARKLLPDEFDTIYRGVHRDAPQGFEPITTMTLRCQHCMLPIQLRNINMLSLRSCDWGD